LWERSFPNRLSIFVPPCSWTTEDDASQQILRLQSGFFYYPGTRIEAQAAEIQIGDGTHLEGLLFTIP